MDINVFNMRVTSANINKNSDTKLGKNLLTYVQCIVFYTYDESAVLRYYFILHNIHTSCRNEYQFKVYNW